MIKKLKNKKPFYIGNTITVLGGEMGMHGEYFIFFC
jgi:hypothetical protein